MPRFLLYALLALCFCPAQALTLAPQSGVREAASLAGHLSALRDAGGTLTVEQIAAAEKAGGFAGFAALPGFLSGGYTASTYWLRFSLQRTPDTFEHWWLGVEAPFLDEVTLYMPRTNDGQNTGFEAIRLGDRHPYAERPVPHRNFVFPILLPDDQPVIFYLRVKTTSSMLVRVFAWQYAGLLADTQTTTALYSAYFGMIALGILSNLVFWLWLRERVYLSYSAYLVMLAGAMMSSGGFATQWLFQHMPLAADRMVGITVGLVYLAGLAFFIGVLRLRQHFPRLNRVMDAVLIFYAAGALAAVAGYYGQIAALLQLVAIVATTAVAIAGPWLLWRGHREYLLYVLAFSVHFAAIVFGIARYLGFLATDVFGDYSVMLTAGLHVVLLNFAVADRVRRSDREKLAAEQRAAELTAEHEAVEQQRQFVAMVSHEFRTPLAVIDSSAQSVEIACAQQHCDLHESISARQQKIRRMVKQLVALIETHLTDRRLEVNLATRRREKFDLRELVGELAQKWRPMLPTPGRLNLSLPEHPLPVAADRQMVKTALSNLIDNAVKYSPPATPIALRADGDRNTAWIEVTNSGAGIKADEINRVFDKFYRTNGVHKIGGAGLGLYLVRKIAREHDGDIEVRSTPGAETVFRLKLPAANG